MHNWRDLVRKFEDLFDSNDRTLQSNRELQLTETGMPKRHIDQHGPDARDEDWAGNNAAFTCPVCGKVFLVSNAAIIHGGERSCPSCGKSKAVVTGGRKSGGEAYIEW